MPTGSFLKCAAEMTLGGILTLLKPPPRIEPGTELMTHGDDLYGGCLRWVRR